MTRQSICYHCDLEIADGVEHQLTIFSKKQHFCCLGCLAIAEIICESNLQDFYRFRSKKNIQATPLLPQELLELEALDNQSIRDTITTSNDHSQSIELGIEGMTCAACAWLIKTNLKQLAQVNEIEVNATTHRAIIKFDKNALLSPILKQIRNLGYHAFPFSEEAQQKSIQRENKIFSRRLVIAGIAMMQIMMLTTGLYIGEYQDISTEHAYFLHWVSGFFATPVVIYSARPFFKNAWNALKHKHFGMDLPVSIAILSGYLASMYSLITNANIYYFDSVVMFTFFLLIGRYLEHRVRLKAILKQQNFRKLIPLSVTKKNADNSTKEISVSQIEPNDLLVIHSGNTVPVDGILLSQMAELNEAILTGEFIPVNKQENDSITSGSTNNSAGFLMRATTDLKNSRLNNLIALQNNCNNITNKETSLADKIANAYVILLLMLVTIVGLIWWQIEPSKTFPVILSLLVVSCPCALSLATPAAITAAVSNLTDQGLMIRNFEKFNQLTNINDIYFDKTGTLTLGKMNLIKTIIYSNNFSKNYSNQIAATMELISNHPIAEAFKHLNITPIANVIAQEVIAGGVTATINNQTFRLGHANFVSDNTIDLNLYQPSKKDQNDAAIILYLTCDKEHVASFILADKINRTAAKAIRQLQQLKFTTTLISGDSQSSSNHVANQLGVKKIIANATPESKLQQLKQAQQQGMKVLMVGDGINDIGALSQADVSITMGNASHLSQSASDAVLVSHDLSVIPNSIQIVKKLNIIIKQNLTWAVFYNIVAIPFAALGLVPAWLAAIGMTSSSLIVVLNALRLRK